MSGNPYVRLGNRVYVDEGDSVGDREITGTVVRNAFPVLELQTIEGQRVTVDLDKVTWWEVL